MLRGRNYLLEGCRTKARYVDGTKMDFEAVGMSILRVE